MSKVHICWHKEGFTSEYLPMLVDIIRITNKDFDFGTVARTRFTFSERTVINQMALNLCSTENMSDGLRLFEDLIRSMDRYIVDETEKMRMYATVLYNYSKFLGLAKRHEEALATIDLGEELCVKHNHLRELPGFAINRSYIMRETGEKDRSLPYHAQAYYGSMLIGRLDNAEIAKEKTKEHFGIVFS